MRLMLRSFWVPVALSWLAVSCGAAPGGQAEQPQAAASMQAAAPQAEAAGSGAELSAPAGAPPSGPARGKPIVSIEAPPATAQTEPADAEPADDEPVARAVGAEPALAQPIAGELPGQTAALNAYPPCKRQPTPAELSEAREAFMAAIQAYQAGDYRQAVRLFEKSLALACNADKVLFNIGRAYEQLGERDKAIAAYEAYLARAGSSALPEVAQKLQALKQQRQQGGP